MKNKKHIIKSETLDIKGAYNSKASKIAKDADSAVRSLLKKYKGELSLCAIESILHTSVSFQTMRERALSIVF